MQSPPQAAELMPPGHEEEVPSRAESSIVARYRSNLEPESWRLVAELLAQWTTDGARSASNFVEYFGCERLLEQLEAHPALRVTLLVQATGAHERVAARKSQASALEDLQLALEEGATTAERLFHLFEPDQWVTILSARGVWEFLIADSFWLCADSASEYPLAKTRTQQVVEAALAHHLIQPDSLCGLLPVAQLVEQLSNSQLRSVVAAALDAGRRGEAFAESSLLSHLSAQELIEQLPPALLWDEIIAPELASANGWPAQVARSALEKPPRKSNPRIQLRSGPPTSRQQPPAKPSKSETSDRISSVPPPSRRFEGESADLLQRLDELERLPLHYAQMDAQVLQSIEDMYRGLAQEADPLTQVAIARGAFGNEHQCASAMLGLLELLNPKLIFTVPDLHTESADTLCVRLLCEEQRRAGAEVSSDQLVGSLLNTLNSPPTRPAASQAEPVWEDHSIDMIELDEADVCDDPA